MTAARPPTPVPAPPTPPDGQDPAVAVLAAIDAVTGCQRCTSPLGTSPSGDFCSEDCQQAWHQTSAAPPAGDPAPDEPIPETGPADPLAWLGPPPAGVTGRVGWEILDAVREFLSRFSVFPHEHCAPALALWYAHTHAAHRFYVTPRLVLDSAEPASGKTRVLEVAQYLVAAPEMTISATPAALFRLVAAGPITILFDEVDAIFTQNGSTHEELRGLLNAGYKRTATIARCVGDAKSMRVQRFPVYAPAALAGIAGAMPATVTTRAITIHMRRRRADETVEPFHERHVARQAQPLRQELAAWAERHGPQLGDARPTMPPGVTDRAAEIWEPLLAIADTAAGHWPTTARAACRHFVLDSRPAPTSTGIRLLTDLRALEEAPWGDLDGKPLDARRLATLLRRYDVKPHDERFPTGIAKGYRTHGPEGLTDAWDRYLPPQKAATAATSATPQVRAAAEPQHVADTSTTPHPSATALTCGVALVAAVAANQGHPPAAPGHTTPARHGEQEGHRP